MGRRYSEVVVALMLVACAPPTDGEDDAGTSTSDDPLTSSSSIGSSSGSTGSSSSTTAMGSEGATSLTGSSGSESTSEGSSSGLVEPIDGVFVRGEFTIPAGTRVEEFSFSAQTEFNPGVLDGRTLLVAVTDVSHPKRDQFVLCPGSHPLDGCATVDYGAFGMTHDNRISFDGAGGAITAHLFKDRSLQPEAEPLPDNE